MIADCDAKRVNTILVKDLSRLSRNNAMMAYYTEVYFLQNDIRFIAINDAIDTFEGENEIMGFKSILNEFYARDISKKVRSSKKISAMKGEFIGGRAAYGYEKNPEDKHKLIIDETAAEVVRRIFNLAVSGKSPMQISTILIKDLILIPSAYVFEKTGLYANSYNHNFPYKWTQWSIRNILRNRVYLGEMIASKQRVKSFKYKKLLSVPEDQWIIVKDTHEPIIDFETFDKVQALLKVKNPANRCLIDNIFIGKLVCADCGKLLGFSTRANDHAIGRYVCNGHRMHTGCSPHSIPYTSLYQFVLDDIKRRIEETNLFDGDMKDYVMKLLKSSEDATQNTSEFDLRKCENRLVELGKITKKLFEQNAMGVINDETYRDILNDYQNEMKELKSRISEQKDRINQTAEKVSDAENFVRITQKYTSISSLDRELIGDLIDKIVIYEATGGRTKDRCQRVDIHYRYLGDIGDSSQILGRNVAKIA